MNEQAPPRAVWTPARDAIADTNLAAFASWLRATRGLDVAEYDAMWRWSVDDLDGFWAAVWDYFQVGSLPGYRAVLGRRDMPGADWFPGGRANLAEFVLRPRSPYATTAVVTVGEDGSCSELSWGELRRSVASFAATLQQLGVAAEDVVVGYLPNIAETVVAALATVSIGAIWSGVGQDYAPQAAIDRFRQLGPKVLVAADGHVFAGKERDNRAAVAQLVAGLPTLEHLIGVSRLGHTLDGALRYEKATSDEVPFRPMSTPAHHPLWVLFSSGTTGLPKGIVHGHGGALLEHAKLLALNWDLKSSDRLAWYTSPSWVMWNFQLAALSGGGSILCYDGAPGIEGSSSLWRIVADQRVTIFGTSPGFLAASQDRGLRPAAQHDLSALRIIGSTGAPLPARAFDYVTRDVGPVPLFSMSGGTDIGGAFGAGAPTVPVWAGEISVRGLGAAVESWDAHGRAQTDQVGELVAHQPMPSMPLRFWNDPDGAKYRRAYFDVYPRAWRHGDWMTLTARGSLVIHGRSDSTLNRHGVRMGSSDIYAAVEALPEVSEALVIGVEESDGGYWMPLFVVLASGCDLDDALVARIKAEVRDKASPRHVPDEVLAVPGIPHTRTGKKLEVPIKRLVQGAAPTEVVDPSVVDVLANMALFERIATERLQVVLDRAAPRALAR